MDVSQRSFEDSSKVTYHQRVWAETVTKSLCRLPGQDREFKACIKIKTTSKPGRPVTKIYLEGPRSLIPLHDGDDTAKPIRCFNSKKAQAAIYIEATDERSFDKQFTELQYDLEKIPQGFYGYDRAEGESDCPCLTLYFNVVCLECRPCSNEELAHVFCSSDLGKSNLTPTTFMY